MTPIVDGHSINIDDKCLSSKTKKQSDESALSWFDPISCHYKFFHNMPHNIVIDFKVRETKSNFVRHMHIRLDLNDFTLSVCIQHRLDEQQIQSFSGDNNAKDTPTSIVDFATISEK